MNDRVAIEVLACLACDRAYQPGDGVDAAPCCDEPRPAFTVTVPATLAPGTLSAAIQRLGWAAWDAGPFFGKVNGVRLEFNTAIAAVQELMDRPTPPEGT